MWHCLHSSPGSLSLFVDSHTSRRYVVSYWHFRTLSNDCDFLARNLNLLLSRNIRNAPPSHPRPVFFIFKAGLGAVAILLPDETGINARLDSLIFPELAVLRRREALPDLYGTL